MSPDERTMMQAHAAYWAELSARGIVVAYGPVDDPAGAYGIGIVLAEDHAALEALMAHDPAVMSAHGMRAEIAPMFRLFTPSATYDAAPAGDPDEASKESFPASDAPSGWAGQSDADLEAN
jgi:uncharacterized protein YciI